jgi:hypothetical protein
VAANSRDRRDQQSLLVSVVSSASAKNKGMDEGERARSVSSINHAALFCSVGRSSLTRITLNSFPEKFT